MSILHCRRALPVAALLLLVACATVPDETAEATPPDSPQATPVATRTPAPTPAPTPTPTPAPTLSYTNPPDPELVEVIPATVGGATVVRVTAEEHGLTPGDVGEVFGEIGLHFRSLAVAFIEVPRLSLFAMRMEEAVALTEDLEPHLAEIGRYVGVAGLDPDEWSLEEVAGRLVWGRSGGEGTVSGTRVYTWIADDLAFLLIGADDDQNRSVIAELPGIPAPTPSPTPTAIQSPVATEAPEPSPTTAP